MMGAVMHFQRTLNLGSGGGRPDYLAVFIGGFGDVMLGCLSRLEAAFPGFLPGAAHATAYYHWDGGGLGVFRDRCDRIAEDLERMRRESAGRAHGADEATVTAAPAPWKSPGGRRRVPPLSAC